TPTSTDPAESAVEGVVQPAAAGLTPNGPDVASTGELVATPVNEQPPMMRSPPVEAENVAVIVVPDGRPDGACAETIADTEPDGLTSWPCLSTVHVSPPPETEDSVTAAPNQPTPS